MTNNNINCTDCEECTQCNSCNKSYSCDQSYSCNKSSYCNQSSYCDKSSYCDQSYSCDKSSSCNKSSYCNKSYSCNQSSYCNQSYSCNQSSSCNKSSYCNQSSYCNKSYSCDQSSSCNKSYYCDQSYSCDQSSSCNQSYSCNKSYYCNKCENLLYCYKLKFKEFHVFNKPVTQCRYNELKALDAQIYNGYELAITQWIEEKDMTDEEKKNEPKFYVMGGYLKIYDYKKAWANLWAKLPQSRKDMLLGIPEFDAAIFLEISGIDVRKNKDSEEKKAKILAKIEELKKQAENL